MVIFGSFGDKWKHPLVTELIDNGVLSLEHHRMCHWSLKVNQSMTKASSTCFITTSTKKLGSHPCQCRDKSRDSHELDFKSSAPSSGAADSNLSQLKWKSHLAIGQKIIPQLLKLVGGRLGSTPESHGARLGSTPEPSPRKVVAFPTEARERAKEAEKQRKAQGIEKRRKSFKIEDVFDDCGADLSGLGSDAAAQELDFLIQLKLVSDSELDVEDSDVAQTYPTIATGTTDTSEDQGSEPWRECPGCRWRRSKTDPSHNRVQGICKHANVAPVVWGCPGCKNFQPAGASTHTYVPGECKFHETSGRSVPTRRRGRHPRQPAAASSSVPVGDAQAQLSDGTDLAAADEEEFDRLVAAEEQEQANRVLAPKDRHSKSASSSGPSSEPVPSPAESSRVGKRGPDVEPRASTTITETATGTPNTSDWTRFDVRSSLRALRSPNPAVVTRELRKVHLRWWHAGRTSMTELLGAAGLPQPVLDRIPDIIKSCRECRMWAATGNRTIPSLTLSTRFNQHVEFDLLFYKSYIIFHLLDRCTRWHAGKPIEDKSESTLRAALNSVWISMFGPMENLYTDGESGFTADAMRSYLKTVGITLKVRAPNQHAVYVERHGAVLRLAMHLTESQCKREGLDISIVELAAQGFFCGNSLTSTASGVTPYNNILGRQPRMLPPLLHADHPESQGDSQDGLREQRIREISVGATIQATSMGRVSRTLGAKSTSGTSYRAGDLVDVQRKAAKKDDPSWSGPFEVLRDSPSEGQIIIQNAGREWPYRYQDVRHTLLVIHSYFGSVMGNPDTSMKIVQDFVESLSPGTVHTFGLAAGRTGSLVPTKATSQHTQVAAALAFTLRNHLFLEDVVTARVSHGTSRYGTVATADYSYITYWFTGRRNVQVEELGSTGVDMRKLIGNRFPEAYSIQALVRHGSAGYISDAVNQSLSAAGSHDSPPEEAPHTLSESVEEASDGDRLSTIPEEDPEDQELWLAIDRSFQGGLSQDQQDIYLAEAAEAILNDTSRSEDFQDEVIDWPCYVPPQWDHLPEPIHVYEHYLAFSADADTGQYATGDVDQELGLSYVELGVTPGMVKCFLDPDGLVPSDEVVFRIFATGVKKTVIARDTDVLTKEELQSHVGAVSAAILEELKTWVKFGTFMRWKRADAQNIMTSRFVAKWKFVRDKANKQIRIIRMRMAIRGFQDWYAHLEENYSATCSRVSQRIVCSETACHEDWDLVTVDIEKAFLQGLTYKEIQEQTGEPERFVFFSLPPGSAAVLRQIPGFENFDERYECLRCIKPGTGTKGAPRAFSLKLSGVTRGPKCRLVPTTFDKELEVRHDKDASGVLRISAIAGKHVDDIKIGGKPSVITQIIDGLEAVFGKLTYSRETFTNTGIRHKLMADHSVQMDQDEYIQALKPIAHPSMVGLSGETALSDVLTALFWSLLGAAAYFLLTQFHMAVYIVALQRKTKSPQVIHIRRLNAVVRIAQKRPARLTYQFMTPTDTVESHADSGFNKEQENGYGIRGANMKRHGLNKRRELIYHYLDSQCRSHKHVTRDSFSSEVRAVVVAADDLLCLALTLHELKYGPVSATEARRIRDEGQCGITTILSTDSMSLWSAVAALVVRIPTEKNLAVHLFWLKELLDTRALTTLRWVDTRDMHADGHTKGSVPRDAILQLMSGVFKYSKEYKDFSAKRPRALRE